MSRRWKETSFLGGSRTTNVRVPFNVALEDQYENVHRSMGDLRPSRSRGNRDPYYSPSRNDGAPFTGSMGMISTPGTEVTMSECKEIGVVEGNRRMPIASFQRDIVMSQDDNMRRAESMSTFTSSGLVRNTNVAGVSFASGWHEQRVVVDSERETSMIAMRTASSTSQMHYSERNQKRSSQIHSKPIKDDEFLKRDYKMHVYGDTADLCEPYGFSNYPDSSSWKIPLDVHHPDINDHIYDEIRESDKFGQIKCQTFSSNNLYEGVQKPVIIDEYLKKPSFKDQDNYENMKSLASFENTVHQGSSEFIENDVEKASEADISKAPLFQPISGCKSTPNLTTFSSSNPQINSSEVTNEETPNVENVEVHSDEKAEAITCDEKALGTEEKVQIPCKRKPYLETNLDDILWLPTPIKTDPQRKHPDDSIETNMSQAESSEMELKLKPAECTSPVNENIDNQAKIDLAITVPDDNLSALIPGIIKTIETDQNETRCSEEYALLFDKDLETAVKTVASSDSLKNHYVADDIDMKISVIAEPIVEPNNEILAVIDQNRYSPLKTETSEESFEESFASDKESGTNMITKTATEELKENLPSSHISSSKVSFTRETQKSKTSKKSVKRPSCPPPPPPAVKILSERENSLIRKVPDAVIRDSDISVCPSPDPSESTLNLAFISDGKTLSENHEYDRLKHYSQDSSFSCVSGNDESSRMSPQIIVENTKESKEEEDKGKCKNTLLEEKKYSFDGEVFKEENIVSEIVIQNIPNDEIEELENVNSVVKEHCEVNVIGTDRYDTVNKETLSVMQLITKNLTEELALLPKTNDLDTQNDEDKLEEISDDSRSASVTLIDELPDDVTFEEKDPKEPPPYSPPPPPPPPPPESESSVVSAEEPQSDLEGHRSPSPPPRPPSPLMYTGPSTPPLYFSSPLPELRDTALGCQLDLLASHPAAQDLAQLTQRNLSHEKDSRYSPSPPPIPPRPKHIGKFFYHPIISLDLHKHIYENIHHTQEKTIGHIADTHSFKNNDCEDIEGHQEHDQYEILYENINSLQLKRDTLGKQDGSISNDDECVYENIRGSSICKDPMKDSEDQQECIYENVESLRDHLGKKTRPTQGKVSGIKETSGLRVHGHYGHSYPYDENFLGHTYETIDKSKSKVHDTQLSKNQKRDHIYDTIRTDESEAEEHQIENKSKNHHERTYEYDKSCFEHQYATVNKTKLVDQTNASSSERSIVNHTYAVIDRSQLEDSLDYKGTDLEEIYENIPRFPTHRNDEKSKKELLQEDCVYENLGAFRKSLCDYKRENAGHSSRTAMSSFQNSSLHHSAEERARTHEERPPTPPPRWAPVTEMVSRPSYSPPPPPVPPFNLDAFLQMNEQKDFGSFHNVLSQNESSHGSGSMKKELFFDYQREKELSYDYRREVQELLHLQKQRRRWIKEMSRQPQGQIESGNRAMMEFYVNNLTSDSDSDNDSAGTSASGGSHDLEEEEHQQQMLDRTYQVIGGADTVLDTIEEDVEEDSGAESSGHWMFSADNTDTDSVIHVPAILDLRPYPVEALKEAESTDSDGTLTIEEDVTERVCYTEVTSGNNQRQEAGVTEGNSHVEAPASRPLHPHQRPLPGLGDSDEGSSRDVEPVTVGGVSGGSQAHPSSEANTHGGKTNESKGHDLPLQGNKTMLSRTEAARLFEKRIDDVFDFESLESCESVYGGNDSAGFPLQGCASPLAGEEVVFNTSATSQPFADASGEFEDQIVNNKEIHESEVFSSNQGTELSSKDTLGEGCGLLPTTPSFLRGTPVKSKHDDAHGESSFSELDNIANGGECNLDQTYVVGKSEDFAKTENTERTEIDSKCGGRGKDGEPLSMDLFGLPVRWTEGEKKGAPVETPVASPTCLLPEAGQVEHLSNDNYNEMNNKGECDELKYDSDAKSDHTCDEEIRSLTKSILKEGERANDDRDASENEIATDNENVVSAAPSEGDFTFAPVGEMSAVEARHHQTATGNLLKSSTDPEQLSVIASAEGESGGTTSLSLGSSDSNGTVGSATMREINLLSSAAAETCANYQSPPGLGPFVGAPRNDVRGTGGQPQLLKTTRHIENFSPFEGEIAGNIDASCHQRLNYDKHQHQLHAANINRDAINGHPIGGDLASGDSDADTDNTDGDYDEEDHFAAELSLRISTVHSEVNGNSRVEERTPYRNSDILSVLTSCRGEKREEEEKAGREDAPGSVSPLASQDGSSPEMPDSLRSSEGRSATRSVETLSEDSGLGDRDVRLTPSSPLPSISEGAPRGVVAGVVPASSSNTTLGTLLEQSLTSVTARPKRQDIRQARIARARSCGDLRAQSASSDTDTEEESGNMRGLMQSRLRGREGSSSAIADEGVHNGEMHYDKPFKSSYANYLRQQYEGEGGDDRRNPNNLRSQPPHPPSSRYQHRDTRGSHPPSESDGSDKEIKSRYRRVREASNNHSRPRRYKSLLEFSCTDPNNASDYYYYKESDRVPRVPHTHSRSASRRRPQPISVDLAEEFLSQERLGTTDQNIAGMIRASDNKLAVNNNTPSATGEGGSFGNSSSSCLVPPTNGIAHSEQTTNGVEVGGGVMPPGSSQGSRGEEGLAKLKDEVTADVRVQCGWPLHASADSAASPTAPYPHHHPLDALHHQQVSSAPLMPNRTPPGPSQRQTHHQYSSSSSSSAQLPNECQPVHTSQRGGDIAIHDPIAQCDPSVSSSNNLQQNSQDFQHQQQQPSFVVSSKLPNAQSQRADGGEVMEEVPITRVRTKTYGSHGEVEVYLARADSGRPPPHPGAATQPVLTPTGGLENRTGSRGVTFSPSVKEVNWRESYYDVENEGEDVSDSVKSSEVIEVTSKEKYAMKNSVPQVVPVTQQQQQEVVRPSQVTSVPPMQTSNDRATVSKLNGGTLEHSTGSSSEAEAYDEKGHPPAQQQKPPTGPIWQRFKLPKISSPKSTRPKIMPKPKSLSPRSSDTENSKQETTTPHESGSSTPSSPESKLKKTPQSPKFFTWGSKREKKPREITRPKTPPPPVPRSSPPPAPRASPPPPPPSPSSSPLPTQVRSGQVVGVQGVEAGKLDSPSSVTLTGFNREGRSDASPVIISAKKREVVTSDNSNAQAARIAPALLIAKKQQLRRSEPPVVTSSASSSYHSCSSGREEEWSDRRSRSVSSSGDDSGDALATSPTSRAAVAKPPLPPHLQRPQTQQQAIHKARLLSARRHYFSQERQTSAPERVSPPKDSTGALESSVSAVTRPLGTPPPTPPVSSTSKHHTPTTGTPNSSSSAANKTLLTKGNFDSSKNLKERFEKFSASTRAERERLARSTPDLSVLIESVRRPTRRIDSCTGGGAETAAAEDIHVGAATSQASASDGETSSAAHAHQGASHTQSKPRQAIHERYKNRAQRIYARSRTQSTGVLETDLDTGASRELLTLRETNLDDLYKDLQHLLDNLPFGGGAPTPTDSKARAKSLLDLEAAGSAMEGQLEAPARPSDTRAKSMEFLLDDGNKASIQPPENELMKGSERQLSEAELRVRRSLQRLDVPEWMKNAQPQQTGFLLRRRDYGSSSGGGGWSAYSSKTASMTSLGSSRAHTPNTPTKVVIPTRVATKVNTGLGGVTSPASNASISPSPSDRSGSLFQYPISRWSTSRLNSGTTTPTGSVTSTRTTPPTYVRQPYLGWRSQTSLASLAGSQSSLTNTGSYLTAADRLALGITSYSQRFVKPSVSAQDKENSSAQANAVVTKSDNEEMNEDASTNGSVKLQVPTDVADVHSSIKEVTSAIVHYCNESTPSPRASPRGSPRPEGPRAPSPRRLVWVESSFVGSRPITSPETPTSSTHAITPTSQLNGHEEPESNEAPSQPPQPPARTKKKYQCEDVVGKRRE